MKKLILFICFLFSFIYCNAQLPTEIKHVEIVSEIKDTMVLLNKPDLDIINTAFYRLEYADSLNTINENLISLLNVKNDKLDSIINVQKVVITNKDTQINNIKTQHREVVSNLEKQVKRAGISKIF